MPNALKDFELHRLGNLVTIQWRGAPKYSVGVLSTASEAEAYEKAALAMEQGAETRPGYVLAEVRACVTELRKRSYEAEWSAGKAGAPGADGKSASG